MKKTINFVKQHIFKFIIEITAFAFTLLLCILLFAFLYYHNSNEFKSHLNLMESQLLNSSYTDPSRHMYNIINKLLDLNSSVNGKSYCGIAYEARNAAGEVVTSSRNVKVMLNTTLAPEYLYLNDYFSKEEIDNFLKFKSDLYCPDNSYRDIAVQQLIQKMEGYYNHLSKFVPLSITFENQYYNNSYTLENVTLKERIDESDIVTYTYSPYKKDSAEIVIYNSTDFAHQRAWKCFAYDNLSPSDIGFHMSGNIAPFDYELYIYVDALGYTLHSSKFVISCIITFLVLQLISITIILLHSYITKRNRIHSEMKALFLNAMAHEMKTPIAVAINCIECIKNNVSPEKNDHYLSIVSEENLRLNTLLENMLTYTRVSDSAYKIKKEHIFMIKEIRQTISHFSTIIEQKNIDVQYDIEADFKIVGDSKLIEMVLDNYISNATKHCNENGKLKVHIDDKSLSIFNEGNHIKEENLNKIWEPLFKEDTSRSEETGSAGMGLAISAEILKQHNLEYGVENNDGGVTFYIKQI